MIGGWTKFRETTTGLWFMAIVGVIAGLSLMITPENTHRLIIQGVGLTWLLDGILHLGKIYLKYIEGRIKSKTGNG